MPFPDNHFDIVTNAFGFRNLTYKNPNAEQYLTEIYRILKKDGLLIIIETSQPENKLLKLLFHIYLRIIVRYLGGLFSGSKSAYRYLANSAINYYNSREVKSLLVKCGYELQRTKLLAGGIAAIYLAVRPE